MNKNTLLALGLIVAVLGGATINHALSGKAITTHSAWKSQVYNLSHHAEEADMILTGTVTAVGDGRWDTADGTRPAEVTDGAIEGIHHQVTIEVNETIKGRPQDTVTVRVDTGSVDGYSKSSPDAATYREGEQVLVFLVHRDGAYHTRSDRFGRFNIEDGVIDRPDVPAPYQKHVDVGDLLHGLRSEYSNGSSGLR